VRQPPCQLRHVTSPAQGAGQPADPNGNSSLVDARCQSKEARKESLLASDLGEDSHRKSRPNSGLKEKSGRHSKNRSAEGRPCLPQKQLTCSATKAAEAARCQVAPTSTPGTSDVAPPGLSESIEGGATIPASPLPSPRAFTITPTTVTTTTTVVESHAAPKSHAEKMQERHAEMDEDVGGGVDSAGEHGMKDAPKGHMRHTRKDHSSLSAELNEGSQTHIHEHNVHIHGKHHRSAQCKPLHGDTASSSSQHEPPRLGSAYYDEREC